MVAAGVGLRRGWADATPAHLRAPELIACGELTSDLVACLIHRSGAMPAGAADQRTMLLFQLRDGRAVEITEYAHDLYAYDEAVGPRAIALPDARKADAPVTT